LFLCFPTWLNRPRLAELVAIKKRQIPTISDRTVPFTISFALRNTGEQFKAKR
jgi:hypothetical protein